MFEATRRLPVARPLEAVLRALPLVAVLAVALFMVEREGGYAGTVWYPAALLVLAVAVTLAAGAARLVTGVRALTIAAVASLGGFTAWSYASIAWAADRSAAWDGANKTLLYFVAFGLLAVWPLSGAVVWPLLLAFGVVVCAEGVGTVESVIHTSHPSQLLIGARLSEPLGYPNATGALYMIAAWAMAGLASRRFVPAPARGLALGLASVSATLNLLTQSRGSLYTLPLVALLYFVLVPGRLRSLAVLGLLALAVLPVVRPVLHVYDADPQHLQSAMSAAIARGLLSALLVAVAGTVFALVDARLRVPPSAIRPIGAAAVAAMVLTVLGLAVAYPPAQVARSGWHSFRYGGVPGGSTHFGGLGSNRYDFWRVGLIEFRRHPVQGIGAGNFLVPYLTLRRSSEQPIFPHSLAIRLLSQTGVVGTLLFVAFLAAVLATVLRIPPGRDRELALLLAVCASVWLLHGLVDWLWEMPTLGVLGVGFLGAACGLATRRPEALHVPRRLARAGLAVGALAATAAAASLVLPWLSQRDVQQALAVWRDDPGAAFATLDRAASLNPVSDDPDLIAGAIASRLGRYPLMRERLERAVRRSPDDWYANLELGIAASLTGDRAFALRALDRAASLDPGEPIIAEVRRSVERGARVDPGRIDRLFAEQDG